jgi:hypothetical protein
VRDGIGNTLVEPHVRTRNHGHRNLGLTEAQRAALVIRTIIQAWKTVAADIDKDLK